MTSSDPYVDVFVQFDDGRLARYTSYVGLIRDRSIKRSYQDQDFWDMEFMLVSLRDEHAKRIAGNRPTTIGQKVYAIYDSLSFGPDITPTDLLHFGSRYDKRLRDVPLLTPMTSIAAKYNDRYEFIIWKLHLDNGREVIGASRYRGAM